MFPLWWICEDRFCKKEACIVKIERFFYCIVKVNVSIFKLSIFKLSILSIF